MSTRSVRTPTSILRLGYARADVTPPVGIYHRMWGAASHDRASGVHRPLAADLILLQPAAGGGPGMARLQLDLVLLANAQSDALIESISAVSGVAPDRVLVTHSHSHAAGFFLPDRMPLPGGELIGPYLDSLKTRVEELTRQALDDLRPAVITYAAGRCDMAANRDYRDEERQIYVTGYNPDAPADDTVVVARVEDEAGKPRLGIVHYACHPTTLAWENSLLSPDFAGAMREVFEAGTGSPCVFFQGACGELGPRDGFTGDTGTADRNGRQLGHTALSAYFSLGPARCDFTYRGPVESGATLGAWAWTPFTGSRTEAASRWAGGAFTVDLPYRDLPGREELRRDLERYSEEQGKAEAAGDAAAARDAGARAERCRRWLGRLADMPEGASFPFRYSVFRLGDAVWITCSGEPYNEVTQELRRRFPGLALLLSPVAGDPQVAYLLPEDRYGLGLYQEQPSCLAPGCLELLTAAVSGRITEISGRQPLPA